MAKIAQKRLRECIDDELNFTECPKCGEDKFSSSQGVAMHYAYNHEGSLSYFYQCDICDRLVFGDGGEKYCSKWCEVYDSVGTFKHLNKEYLKEQVSQNKSSEEIANQIGVQAQLVNKYLNRYNINRKYENEQWLREQVDRNLNLTEISEKAGIESNQTIRRKLNEFDISLGNESECYDCGEKYAKLSTHWARSDCSWPEIDDKKWELLKGMLMGDGSLNMSSKNPSFVVSMANKEFLQWFSEKMGFLSSNISLTKTAEEGARHARKTDFRPNAKAENYSDIYTWTSIRHPQFNKLAEWYGDEGKKYPEDLELSHKAVKMWYCGDGWLNWTDKAKNGAFNIKCTNEIENEEYLVSLFEELGYSPTISRDSIKLNVEDTKEILEKTRPAPDGFGYKWATESREQYKRLISKQKE